MAGKSSDGSDAATRIAAGYIFSGAALDLGVVVIDNTAHPDAHVRIPLSMMNRHGTADDATALAKAVPTFPRTFDYDLAELLTQLGTGEAVVTVLSDRGARTPVARTRLVPPHASMGQLDPGAQKQAVKSAPLNAKYGSAVDRNSAHGMLAVKHGGPGHGGAGHAGELAAARGVVAAVLGSSAFKSVARSAASSLGREIAPAMFGTAKRRR